MNQRTAKAWYYVALGLILVAGALTRLYGAWAMRVITDYDCSIVGLMARHMAEGRELPVFFYGQAYMGSFEPALSALLFRLFGESGFILNLGPALLAVAALVTAVVWARDAGGTVAAAIGGLILLTGPDVYYRFQFAARGGYMAGLFFGTLVLWLGSRAAAMLRAQRPVPSAFFFLIGLLAGLGWWSNMMVTSALLVSAGLLLLAARGNPRRAGIWPGGIGFLLGSAPFWIWNALHGWASFRMDDYTGTLSPLLGLSHLLTRYRQLVGAWPAFTTGSTIVFIFYPVGVILGAWILLRELRRRQATPGALAAMAAAAAHLSLSLIIFIFSRQAAMNTARFLVPMLPSAAILCAAGLAQLPRRAGTALGFAAVLLLAAAQSFSLVSLHEYSAKTAGHQEHDRELAVWLAEQPIEIVYAHFMHVALNFRIGENPPFTDLRLERYRPFAETAEKARHTAFEGDHGGIREFLSRTGGQSRTARVAVWGFNYDLSPPRGDVAEIPPDAWASFTDAQGRDVASLAADRNVATIWTDPLTGDDASTLVVRLDESRALREVRLWAPDPESVPRTLRIEILPAGEDAWQMTHDATHRISHFYWCGPRPYWSGRRAHLAFRFSGDPRIRAIRFIRPAGARHPRYPWRLTELQLFEPEPDPVPDPDIREMNAEQTLDALWAALRDHGIRRLYAGRWLSTRAYDAMNGTVNVELNRHAYPKGVGRRDGAVLIDAATAFAVESEDLPLTLLMLRKAGYTPHTQPVGPWSLIVFDPDETITDSENDLLWWTGRHLLRKH